MRSTLRAIAAATLASVVATLLPTAPVHAETAAPSAAPPRIVTVVKVPRPWYAADLLIIRAFARAVPEYAAIDGLQTKFFTLAEDGRLGGIYEWRSREQAAAWYGPGWMQRVRDRYGEPSIDWYTVEHVVDGPARADATSQLREAVATRVDAATAARVDDRAPGLIRRQVLRDDAGRRVDVLLWQSRQDAVNAVGEQLSVQRTPIDPVSVRTPRLPSSLCAARAGDCAVEYFDAPVLLISARRETT